MPILWQVGGRKASVPGTECERDSTDSRRQRAIHDALGKSRAHFARIQCSDLCDAKDSGGGWLPFLVLGW